MEFNIEEIFILNGGMEWRMHNPDGMIARGISEENAKALIRMFADLRRMKKRFGFTYCAYCGQENEIDAPESTEAIGKHIKTCEKHPMRIIERERDAALSRERGLLEAFDKQAVALKRMGEEVERLKRIGVAEMMLENPSIDSWVRELEARCLKAEAEAKAWREALEQIANEKTSLYRACEIARAALARAGDAEKGGEG